MANRSIYFLLFSALCAPSVQAEELVWKSEAFADDCQEFAGPKLDKDGNLADGEWDFMLHKCKTKYGPTMWLMYQDSARMSIGFGDAPSAVWTGASLTRGDWPLEWGGVESNGKFEARSATVRFSWEGDGATRSGLIVYKVLGNEPGCIVSSVDPGPGENERARQIASSVSAGTKCKHQPDALDGVK